MENPNKRQTRRSRGRASELQREEQVNVEDHAVNRLLQAYEHGRRITVRAEQGSRDRGEAAFRKFEAFARLEPPRFNGEDGFKAAEEWLAAIKSRLEVCQAPLKQWVTLAAYYLENAARFWWEGIKRGYEGDAAQIPWTWFEEKFEQRFMGAVHKEVMRSTFITLKQLGQTVTEYNGRFLSLSQYAPDIVNNAYRLRRQYLDGLDPDIAIAVDNSANQGLQALMDAAEQVDVYLKRKTQLHLNQNQIVQQQKTKVSGQGASVTKTTKPNKQPLTIATKLPHLSKSNWCNRCKLPHSKTQCRYLNRTCYNCGSPDHWVKDCPRPYGYPKKGTISGISADCATWTTQRKQNVARGNLVNQRSNRHATNTVDGLIQEKGTSSRGNYWESKEKLKDEYNGQDNRYFKCF
ncbi:hypothetical protein LUZ61_003090 [Rhynchospora tenuis]|uniref:CCHC-type domain-containing protein n=1 Tax=Rhynchospora tenuis TaxID=198213 RepID=A0AAD6ESH8_9POAL|nr:hypothetical protein LUZ61_003090 [Rhynchospora tenuis]